MTSNTGATHGARNNAVYGDRFIPMGVNTENWASNRLQETKRSKVLTMGTIVAEALFPNADTRVLEHSRHPIQKPYCAKVFKEMEVTYERILDAPGLTKEFADNVLTTSKGFGQSYALFLDTNDKNSIFQAKVATPSETNKWDLKDNEDPVSHIQFSNDGTKIYGSQWNSLFTIDLPSGRETRMAARGLLTLDCAKPDLLAIGSIFSKVILSDMRQIDEVRILRLTTSGNERDETFKVIKCAFSPDDNYVAAGTGEGAFMLFDRRKDNAPLTSYKVNSAVKAIDFDRSHVFFGGGNKDGKVRSVSLNSSNIPLDSLVTVDLKRQVTTIKTIQTAGGTDLWVATNNGVSLLRYRNTDFFPGGNLPPLNGHKVFNMEIIDDTIITTCNDKEVLMFTKTSELKEAQVENPISLEELSTPNPYTVR